MQTTRRDPSPTRRVSTLINSSFRLIDAADTEAALNRARTYAIGVLDCALASGYIDDDTYAIRSSDVINRADTCQRDLQARAGRIAAEYLD